MSQILVRPSIRETMMILVEAMEKSGDKKMSEETTKLVREALKLDDDADLDDAREAWEKTRDLREKLKGGDIAIDWNGHMKGGKGLSPHWNLEIWELNPDSTVETQWVDCYVCGERLFFMYDGDKTVTCTTECKHQSGLFPYSFEIDIPSGKFIADDDLRRCASKEINEKGNAANIVTEGGIIEYIKAYLEADIGIFFVGNTCPGVYRIGENRFLVGNLGTDEDGEERTLTKADLEIIEHDIDGDTDKAASITTDLWWVSIMDYDKFLASCAERGEDAEKTLSHWALNTVETAPGRYRITYNGRGDDTYPEIFATMERIGDCETE